MNKLSLATLVAFSMTLGACSISIEDHDMDDSSRHSGDSVSVTLPNGHRDSFTCPVGTQAFISRTEDGLDVAYGCRTNGADPLAVE